MTNAYKESTSSITLDDAIPGRDIAEAYTIGFVDGAIEEMNGSHILLRDFQDTLAQGCVEEFKKTYGVKIGEKYMHEIIRTFHARIEHHKIGATH